MQCSTNGLTSCEWVTHNVQLPGGRFQFEVPHSLPPYTEETTMMEVTAEAITTTLSVIRKTEKFYLRDISEWNYLNANIFLQLFRIERFWFFSTVQPGRPRIVKCQEVGDMLKVSVEPPSGWSTPHSFFSLEHEFEYRLIDDGRVNAPFHQDMTRRTLFCIWFSSLIHVTADSNFFLGSDPEGHQQAEGSLQRLPRAVLLEPVECLEKQNLLSLWGPTLPTVLLHLLIRVWAAIMSCALLLLTMLWDHLHTFVVQFNLT